LGLSSRPSSKSSRSLVSADSREQSVEALLITRRSVWCNLQRIQPCKHCVTYNRGDLHGSCRLSKLSDRFRSLMTVGRHICCHFGQYLHFNRRDHIVIGMFPGPISAEWNQGANAEHVGLVIGGRILLGFGSTGQILPDCHIASSSLIDSHRKYPVKTVCPLVCRIEFGVRVRYRYSLESSHDHHC